MLMRLLYPTPIAILLLAGVAIGFAVGARQLGFWTEDGPGPGLLPFVVALLLLPLLVVALRERVPEEEPFRAMPLAGIVLTCAYAAMLPYLGFLLPTLLLIIAWVRLFHRESWLRCTLLGVGLTAAGTVLFDVLLKVPMPLLPGWL